MSKLKRSLYGLKQAPWRWNQRFVDFMKKQKFSTAKPCIFVRQCNGKKLIVAIYVDDGLIAGSDESKINVFIHQLRRTFKIMTGTLSNFMGMQTEQRRDGIFVFQRAYTEKVLDGVMMHEANRVATPCDRGSVESEDSVGSHVPYREAVGYLMYLMNTSRQHLPCREQLAQWIDQLRQTGLMSNVSSSICGEQATVVCCTELVTVRGC